MTFSASYDSIMVGGLVPHRRSVHMAPFNHGGVDINNIPKNIRQGADIGIVVDIWQYAHDNNEVFVTPSGMLLATGTIPSGFFKFVYALGSLEVIYKRTRCGETDERNEFEAHGCDSYTSDSELYVPITKCRHCQADEFQGAVHCSSCRKSLEDDFGYDSSCDYCDDHWYRQDDL